MANLPRGPVDARLGPRAEHRAGHRPLRAGWGRPADRRGQGLVEYGIILGSSVLLMAILLIFFDDQVAAVLHWLTNQLP